MISTQRKEHELSLMLQEISHRGKTDLKRVVSYIRGSAEKDACGRHLVLRAAYIVFLSGILLGSFFMPRDNPSRAKLLATYPISNGLDLAQAAHLADLIPSRRLSGYVDVIRRIDEQKVDLVGWAADGRGTALEVLVFVARHSVATTQTAGERPDVTAALRLGFGANKILLSPRISLAREAINPSWWSSVKKEIT
jgi:hypothetical protein